MICEYNPINLKYPWIQVSLRKEKI
uniref:Uncharacterized protein n=1 Tax=Rhizophora mucronata TaxID=61149 RepID=A0A2P2PE82_RHIMU